MVILSHQGKQPQKTDCSLLERVHFKQYQGMINCSQICIQREMCDSTDFPCVHLPMIHMGYVVQCRKNLAFHDK